MEHFSPDFSGEIYFLERKINFDLKKLKIFREIFQLFLDLDFLSVYYYNADQGLKMNLTPCPPLLSRRGGQGVRFIF